MKKYVHPKLGRVAYKGSTSETYNVNNGKSGDDYNYWYFEWSVEELLALGFEEVKEEEKLTVDGEELTIEDTRFFINGLRITVDECGLSNEEILERLGAEKGGTYTCEVVEEKEKDWIDECVHDIFEYQRGRPKEDETDTVSVRRIIEKHMPKQKKFTTLDIMNFIPKTMTDEKNMLVYVSFKNFLRDHDLLEE